MSNIDYFHNYFWIIDKIGALTPAPFTDGAPFDNFNLTTGGAQQRGGAGGFNPQGFRSNFGGPGPNPQSNIHLNQQRTQYTHNPTSGGGFNQLGGMPPNSMISPSGGMAPPTSYNLQQHGPNFNPYQQQYLTQYDSNKYAGDGSGGPHQFDNFIWPSIWRTIDQ